MYTRCPNCDTVYEISREHLGIAKGDVRCGECDKTFNALDYLSPTLDDKPLYREPVSDENDLPGEDPQAPTTASDTPDHRTDEEDQGGRDGDRPVQDQQPEAPIGAVEQRATPDDEDAGEEDTPAVAVSAPEARDIGSALPSSTPWRPGDTFWGTTLTEGLDAPREFTVQQVKFQEHVAGYVAAEDEPGPDDEAEPAGEQDQEPLDADKESAPEQDLQDDGDEPAPDHEPLEHDDEPAPDHEALEHEDEPAPDQEAQAADHEPAPEEHEETVDQDHDLADEQAQAGDDDGSTQAGAGPLPEEVRQDPELEIARLTRPPPAQRLRNALWGAVAVLMLAAMLAQVAHHGRARWLHQALLGPPLYKLYMSVGLDQQIIFDVNRYVLTATVEEDSRPASGPVAADRLRLLARITNRATIPQPAPVLRLSLHDPWGDRIAAHDFTPIQYLPYADRADASIAPGQRLRIELPVTNLGQHSDAYTVDVCLPAGQGLRCADSG